MCRLVTPLCNPIVNPKRYENFKGILSDIRPLIKQLTIYENILSPTLVASMLIQDSIGLSSLLPLVGIERIDLVFRVHDPTTNTDRQYGTTSNPVSFMVYAQVNRMLQTMGAEQYELLLVSPEFMSSTEKRISRSYENVRVENVVSDIFHHDLKSQRPFVDVEQTNTPTSIVMPFVTPLDAIKLLMLYGQNSKDETNFLFYETLDGFHFQSIRKAIRDANKIEVPTVTLSLAGTTEVRSTAKLIYADQIDVTSGFNMLYMISQGYFASTTYMLDVLEGRYDVAVTRSSDPGFAGRSLIAGANVKSIYDGLGDASLNMMNPTARLFVVPTTEFASSNQALVSKDPGIKNNFIARTIDGRNRELISLQLRTIRARVPGSPDVHAGQLVNVIIPTPLNNNQYVHTTDDIASRRYFIVAAQHTLINSGHGDFLYETIFEAGTDS